jgi:hypothetical protein
MSGRLAFSKGGILLLCRKSRFVAHLDHGFIQVIKEVVESVLLVLGTVFIPVANLVPGRPFDGLLEIPVS